MAHAGEAVTRPLNEHEHEAPKRSRWQRIAERVAAIAEPICEARGTELVLVEYRAEAMGKVLRLYIDKPGGVTLDDCAAVSGELNDVLDVTLEELGPYSLEVSSPGLERPLGKETDFERFRGQTAKIQTSRPLNGRRNFTGILAGIRNGMVSLTIENGTVAIPYADIKRARLVERGE
jgi:ribosome maturation factor RimP